jgi:transcriptional regulator with XRE-family HTH domain
MAKKGAQASWKSHRKDPVVRAAFARVIVELRRQLKLKQHQVAERSGYSEKYIGNLERRKNTPSLTAAIEISNALEADPRDVLSKTLMLMPRFKRLERREPEAADV